jgi:PAS domain S-box-containing protein
MKLRVAAKLTLFIISMVIISSTSLGWFFVKHEIEAIKIELHERANMVVRNLAYNSEYSMLVGDKESLIHLLEGVLKQKDIVYIKIEDKEGEIIAQAGEKGDEPIKDYNAPIITELFPKELGPISNLEQGKKKTIGWIQLSVSLLDLNQKASELIRLITIIVVIVITISALVTIFGVKFLITRPMIKLLSTIKKIGKGNLSYRVEIKTQDEIGQLALAFNKMTETLSKTLVSKTFVDNIIRSMIDTLIVIAPDEMIRSVNNATLTLLKYERKELIGKAVETILGEAGTPFKGERLAKLVEQNSLTYETYYETKDNEKIPVILSCSVMKDKEGDIICIVCTGKDITERKRTEEKLRIIMDELARSNKELEHFAYIASHDLQEPLRMVSSFVQLLERRYKGKLDTDAEEFIAFAVDGATRMQRMINDLLTYSRVGTRGKPFAPTDSNTVLEQALMNLQIAIEESNAVITYDPLPAVMADVAQLIQLFQNLIGNAIKFHGDKVPQVHVKSESKNNEWIFSVQDKGVGIDPKDAKRIFLIFQRLHTRIEYPGTGIGLAVCKKIVERHGGRIWVESEPGKGSIFYFTIPKKEVNQNDFKRNW